MLVPPDLIAGRCECLHDQSGRSCIGPVIRNEDVSRTDAAPLSRIGCMTRTFAHGLAASARPSYGRVGTAQKSGHFPVSVQYATSPRRFIRFMKRTSRRNASFGVMNSE